MISLPELLKLKFPAILLNGKVTDNVVLKDHGNGPIIDEWSVPGESKPSQEDIDSWQQDPVILEAYQYKLNSVLNESIYDQLDQLDLKTIRALRTNDTVRIQELEQQAISLRAQLLPIKVS